MITANPVSKPAAAGATVSFTAAATNATSTQWQLSTNGGSTWTNIAGATSSSYSVTAAATMSGYQYRVLFTNSSGSVTTSAATLTVGTPITITSNPQSTSVAANTSVTFTTSAIGTPAPTVQWQLSTDNAATWTNISGATATSYSVTATTAMSGYKYRAFFTSPFGTAATSPATLTISAGAISGAPVITANPVSKSAVPGAMVSFTAAASGTPAPAVQWQASSNGTTWINIPGATATTFTLTTAATQNGYQFRAVFASSGGTAITTAAKLTITATATAKAVAVQASSLTAPAVTNLSNSNSVSGKTSLNAAAVDAVMTRLS